MLRQLQSKSRFLSSPEQLDLTCPIGYILVTLLMCVSAQKVLFSLKDPPPRPQPQWSAGFGSVCQNFRSVQCSGGFRKTWTLWSRDRRLIKASISSSQLLFELDAFRLETSQRPKQTTDPVSRPTSEFLSKRWMGISEYKARLSNRSCGTRHGSGESRFSWSKLSASQ